MKILLTLFVLFFSLPLIADNIKDYEIDGVSIGDSLLNYYSLSEIENETDYQLYDYMKESKFVATGFTTNDDSKYDHIQFTFKYVKSTFLRTARATNTIF